MNQADIDRRLGLLIRGPQPAADDAFADRVVSAVLVDRSFRQARKRAWHRATLDCAGAVTVGATFFFLSQTEHASVAGTISLQGPAMAGLIMLVLWVLVALPASAGDRSGRHRT